MSRQLLVEGDVHQARVAVLESGRLVEFFVERASRRGLAGDIYKGRVRRVLPGMRAAFVDLGLERDGYLFLGAFEDRAPGGHDRAGGGDLPRQGQEIVVQIAREQLADKGPRVSLDVTLPGRHLVLTPRADRVAVSKRIEDPDERERLRRLAQGIRGDAPGRQGCIVRTAASGATGEDLARDYAFLEDSWREIDGRASASAAPALLRREEDLAVRVIRDDAANGFDALLVEGVDAYRAVRQYVDRARPRLASRVERSRPGLFERHRIDDAVDAALEPRAPLPSGGYLVINQTEALVSIDVNSGRDTGSGDFADTVLRTNLEAVREAVRQIRLRDLSGILVIDLIDMERPEDRRRVFERLEEELAKDRARKRVLEISDFGLAQLTRQGRRLNLERALTEACPTCRGRGRIKSVTTTCLELRRTCLARARRGSRQLAVQVHPDVLNHLRGPEAAVLDGIQGAFEAPILIRADPALHRERFLVSEIGRS